MILHPVIVSVPSAEGLKPRERIAQQRKAADCALHLSAGYSGVRPWVWEKNEANVPLPHDGLYWSISHKPQMAAAVIADRPVGIDIEFIEPRSAGLADKIARDDEWQALGGRNWPEFFRMWTAKEAALKANGVGVAGFLDCRLTQVVDRCHVALVYCSRPWEIEFRDLGDHLAAVTCVGSGVTWHIQGGARAG